MAAYVHSKAVSAKSLPEQTRITAKRSYSALGVMS